MSRRHVCEPENYPTALGQEYRCDRCGARHYAFDVHADLAGDPKHAALLRNVPAGTLGWTTTRPEATR